jgi:hypothetical protein
MWSSPGRDRSVILSQSTSAPEGPKVKSEEIAAAVRATDRGRCPSNGMWEMTPRITSQPRKLFWVMIPLLGAQPALEVAAAGFEMTSAVLRLVRGSP